MPKLPFQTLYFEDLAVGMRETLQKTVENEDVIGFAELSGDHNPIHLSEHFARKTRFGERIVHGLYTASLISAVIGMRLPGPGAVYISQTLNFRGPVKIGDVVDVSVEVTELTEKGRRVRLHVRMQGGRQGRARRRGRVERAAVARADARRRLDPVAASRQVPRALTPSAFSPGESRPRFRRENPPSHGCRFETGLSESRFRARDRPDASAAGT